MKAAGQYLLSLETVKKIYFKCYKSSNKPITADWWYSIINPGVIRRDDNEERDGVDGGVGGPNLGHVFHVT